MREIGSEFSYQVHDVNKSIDLPKGIKDYAFVFSGRTAIEVVLKNEPHIRKAMLPSYCCASMIEPFRKSGIKVCFYDVNYINGLCINIEIQNDVDAILWCNYFGYRFKMPDFTEFINSGGIVIEDITHSFYSINKYSKQSKYLIASIRKWEPILCGGYCASTKTVLNHVPYKLPDEQFVAKRKNAMFLKKKYLEGNNLIEKEEFLKEFADCNAWLSKYYSMLAIDKESIEILKHIDSEKHFEQRRRNAMVLQKNLKEKRYVKLLFDDSELECPLFVPIVVDCNERKYLRNLFLNQGIYCPVHWPHPNDECISNLYDMEISLVCDHRYNENDMLRIVNIINEFEENKLKVDR